MFLSNFSSEIQLLMTIIQRLIQYIASMIFDRMDSSLYFFFLDNVNYL